MKTCFAVLMTVLAVAVLLAGSPAQADVVGPPPSSCPNGAEPDSCHGGPYCPPWRCTGDHECTGGRTCEERDLCIREIDCGGRETWMTDDVEGNCSSGSECDVGACRTMSVCVSYEEELTGRDGGCGCRMAAPGRAAGAVALALVVAAAVLGWRRRRDH